ncbi:MAG: hypothetical protein ABEH56_06860 [Salinirussus sp.]
MSDRDAGGSTRKSGGGSEREQDLRRQVADLARTLEELESEVQDRGSRRPSVGGLVRFTSEVTVPAIILVLRSNVEALRLLQRALRLADGRQPTESEGLRSRAESASRTALSQLEEALSELATGLDGQPPDGREAELLDEARGLQQDVEESLDELDSDRDGVGIDVESELQSIKDDVDDGADSDA